MQRNRVLGLFKFGKRDHIEEFVRDGHLFMNTLTYFRKLEADLLRSDKHEGAAHCLQVNRGKLCVNRGEEWVDIATISHAQMFTLDGSEDTTNVFCMYALRESAADGLVDPRNFDFGDTFAVLTNAEEFLRRVHAVAAQNNVTLKQGLVEYVDRAKHNGPVGIFRKFADFAYQSEFRIAVVPGAKGPFSLTVGDLSDILIVGDLCNLSERIRIQPSDSV